MKIKADLLRVSNMSNQCAKQGRTYASKSGGRCRKKGPGDAGTEYCSRQMALGKNEQMLLFVGRWLPCSTAAEDADVTFTFNCLHVDLRKILTVPNVCMEIL